MKELSTSELVLLAIKNGFMIQGYDKKEGVYAVCITAITKKMIKVYSLNCSADQETALRDAIIDSFERKASNVSSIKK